MTIKATFPDGTIMLFGDSYKSWIYQLAEYCRAYKMPRPAVTKCRQKWIGYGGLKWCAESELGECLKEEGQGRTVDYFAKWSPLNQIERRTLKKHVCEFPLNAHAQTPATGASADTHTNHTNT